jgi:hypothetical protein
MNQSIFLRHAPQQIYDMNEGVLSSLKNPFHMPSSGWGAQIYEK